MAEAFDLVRTVRQHLRRSAMLLDEGRLEDALAQADAALALDPQSLPAQAMRDRVCAARLAAAPAVPPPAVSRPFVPHGVNAASWRGFEQRITERRFKALLETINTSIVAGDAMAARAAFEEARALRPDDPVLPAFEARVAAVPIAIPSASKASPRIWMRAMGAAALFLLGVSLVLGLEWFRPGESVPSAPAPVAAPKDVPASVPVKETRPEPSPDLGAVPIAMNEEEESVPAIVTPPEPLLRPAGTTGAPSTEIAARSVTVRESAPPAVERMPESRVAEAPRPAPAPPAREVADEFVSPPQRVAVAADAGPAVAPPITTADTPVSADVRGDIAAEPPAAMASVISVPSTLDQQIRVEEVLRRYARAYGQLDASAARAVWPTVDERALAQAFRNLSSQRVSFDDCNIDIRGVVANASCRGQATYAPKVGNREPRTESRNWQFELRRDGDAWRIVDVDARRQSSEP